MDDWSELSLSVNGVFRAAFAGSLADLKRAVNTLLQIDSQNYPLNTNTTTTTSTTVGTSNGTEDAPRDGTDPNKPSRKNGKKGDLLNSLEVSSLEFLRDAKGHSVAHVAAAGGNLDVLQALLATSPNLAFVEDNEGENALFYSIRSIASTLTETERVGYCSSNCPNCPERPPHSTTNSINSSTNSGGSTGKENKLDCLLLLIGQSGVNCLNKSGMGPLHVSAELGDALITQILLHHSANVNLYSDTFGTPLTVAVMRGHADVIDLLLAHGADPNVTRNPQEQDENYSPIKGRVCPPPLVFAASCGQIGTVRALITHGAAVNLADSEGWTALHCAAEYGHLEMCKLLVERGADPNIITEGKNAYHLSVINGHSEVAQFLKSHTRAEDILHFIHNPLTTTTNSSSGGEGDEPLLREDELTDGQLEDIRRRVEEAKECAREMIKIGDYTNANNSYSKAISMCPSGPTFDPLRAVLHSNRSFTNLKLKRYPQAIEDANQTIKLDPGWSKGYLRLALVRRELGEPVDYLHGLFQAFVRDSQNSELKSLFQREFERYRRG